MTARACPRCGAPATDTATFCRACGAPLAAVPQPEPTPPPPFTGPPPPPPKPDPYDRVRGLWDRRPRGRTALFAGAGLAVLIVLALAGYLAAVGIGNARHPPDEPVRALFDALAARDTGTAAEVAACSSVLCAGGALATGYEPPADVRIGEIAYGEPDGDADNPDKSVAYVPVTYRLGDKPQSVTMRVQRIGSGLSRPFRLMSGATGRLTVTADHLEQVQLGGQLVPVNQPGGLGVTALPGTYTVKVPDGDPLFGPAPDVPARIGIAAVADAGAAPVPLAVPVQIREGVTGQVEQQIKAFLDECAKQVTLTPRSCPFRVKGIVIGVTGVRWSIEQPPVIEIVPAEEPEPTDPPATVRTVTPGRAGVTYSAFTSAGGDRTTFTEEIPVEIKGTVGPDPANPDRVLWTN